jgi:hypothetical protein
MVSFILATQELPTPAPPPSGHARRAHAAQQLDILGERRVGARHLFDLAHRVHDGGVIAAAELAADLRQRPHRQLLGQIHRDLTRPGDGAGPAIGSHLA